MPSEMFGAPIGIGAAEADQRENVLGGLAAAKLLGEIEKQPAERALTEAHARLYGAQAGEKEMDLRAQEAMAKATASGEFGGDSASMADPLFKMAGFAWKNGYMNKGVELATKAGTILQSEYAAKNSQANAQLRQFQLQRQKIEQNASLAASVTDQASYDRAKMALSAQGQDVSDMPLDYASAAPMLRQIAESGMKALDILKSREDAIKDKSLLERRSAQNRVSDARIKELDATVKLRKLQADRIEKELGPDAPLTEEVKRALIESRRSASEFRETKIYEPLPKDPKNVMIGKKYKGAGGRYLEAVGRDAEGLPLFTEVSKAKVRASIVLPADDEDEDEN